jgi:hypothetical protein
LFSTPLELTAASFGTMSRSNTSQPTLAKWQAMRLPMTPDPRTATFFMFRLVMIRSVFYRHDAKDAKSTQRQRKSLGATVAVKHSLDAFVAFSLHRRAVEVFFTTADRPRVPRHPP